MSGRGFGRVKTPTRNLRVEIPSRFRQFEKQNLLAATTRRSRENNSAHSWLVHARSQGHFRTFGAVPNDVRFTPDTVAKVENRATPKISRMSIFSGLRHCNAVGSIRRSARRRMNNAPAVLKKFVRQSKKTFATLSPGEQTSPSGAAI